MKGEGEGGGGGGSGQARIQDSEGGVSYIQKGGFRTGISGADPNCCRVLGKSTSKKKLQTAVGGVSDHPKKNLYPRMGGGGREGGPTVTGSWKPVPKSSNSNKRHTNPWMSNFRVMIPTLYIYINLFIYL